LKFITYLLVLFTLSSASWAEPDTLKVGIIDLRPWGYMENGKVVGLQRDVFDALSETTKIPFDYQLLPLNRLQLHLKSGRIDLASLFKRKKLMPYVELVAWVSGETYYLVGPKGINYDRSNLSHIKHIGVIMGEENIVQKSLIDKYNLTAKLDVAGVNYDTSFKKLKAGRIDALCIAGPGLQAYLTKVGMSETFIEDAFVIESQEGHLQFSIKSPRYTPNIISILANGFETLRDHGVLLDIDNKYQVNKK